MKTYIKLLFIAASLLLLHSAEAQIVISDNGLRISDISTQQIGNRMDVSMAVDMSQLKIKSNHSLRVTPYLTDGREIIQMPAIIIDGRRRSIVHLRKSDEQFPSSDIYVRRLKNKEQVISYEYDMPYESWMQNAEFALREEWCACHDMPYSEDIITIATMPTVQKKATIQVKDLASKTKLAYAIPKQDNTLQSSTFDIYFPVNKSQIELNFKDNNSSLDRKSVV